MERLKDKLTNIVAIVLVLGLVILSIIGVKSLLDRPPEPTVIKISETLEPASDLISTKYYYTDAEIYEDYKELFGVKLPFTTDKSIFVYDGVISVGIDLSQVEYAVDNSAKTITMTLPEIKILANEIDQDSFEFPYVSNSVFNQNEIPSFTKLLAELKELNAEKLLQNMEFMATVRMNTELVLRSFLTASDVTADYQVIVN